MKDEFVTNVLAKMMGVLTQEQCQELKTALYMELFQTLKGLFVVKHPFTYFTTFLNYAMLF